MKWVFIFILSAAGLIWWLNGPQGEHFKHRFEAARDRNTQLINDGE